MKTWLKGGLIGIVIGFIFPLILFYMFRPNMINNPIGNFLFVIDFIALIFCGGFCTGDKGIIRIITAPISYFIIGAIIGLIIQKVRK